MNIDDQININRYGQDILPIDVLVRKIKELTLHDRKLHLENLTFYIMQSKANDEDVKDAIKESRLKSTYTPCILLQNGGVKEYNLKKIIALPDNEMDKVVILLLHLFKIAYKKRFEIEKNNINKWWYWDLSDETKIDQIRSIHFLNRNE